MAKVTGPLFSIDAAGKFGDSMVFAKWKGINYVRRHTHANQPNTARQRSVRNRFTEGAAMYQLLTGDDKFAWKTRAAGRPLTGYNLFMKYTCDTLKHMPEFNLISKIEVENISADSVQISFEVEKDGPVYLHYGENAGSYRNSIFVDAEAAEVNTVMLENLEPEIEYFFRITQETQQLMPPSNIDAYTVGAEGNNTVLYGITAVTNGKETYANMAHLGTVLDTADMNEDNFVELNWQPIDGADEYRIYRMEATGDHELGLVAINQFANFQDTGMEAIKPGIKPPETNEADLFKGETGDYSFLL